MQRQVITIDGPSGAGKSTVAKILSQKLGWSYLDSGALYRLVALHVIENNISSEQETMILEVAEKLKFRFETDNGKSFVILNNKDVTHELRNEDVGLTASKISQIGSLRKSLIKVQQQFDHENNLVTDGRDMGTIIFPNAELKIFLTASSEIRALRRYDEIKIKKPDISIDYKTILERILIRDENDLNRDIAPLNAAEDSILINTDNLDINKIVEKIILLWQNRRIRCR